MNLASSVTYELNLTSSVFYSSSGVVGYLLLFFDGSIVLLFSLVLAFFKPTWPTNAFLFGTDSTLSFYSPLMI